jgi:hypothetical protein
VIVRSDIGSDATAAGADTNHVVGPEPPPQAVERLSHPGDGMPPVQLDQLGHRGAEDAMTAVNTREIDGGGVRFHDWLLSTRVGIIRYEERCAGGSGASGGAIVARLG